MSNTSNTGFLPAVILQIDAPKYPCSDHTVHIWAVYGGNNALFFRCPCCGVIHAHGAGRKGGASDGKRPLPHCTDDHSHFLDGKPFQWCLHELIEGMDISLAGDLTGKNKPICARRKGEAGYDQLENGRVDDSSYRISGVKHE